MCCPNSPEDWEKMEEKFRTIWNVHHAVGAIEGKHIAMKKQKKSGSDYYHCKGFFSMVLLALVNTEYRFLWINVGFEGEDRRWHLGASAPEPLGGGRAKFVLFHVG